MRTLLGNLTSRRVRQLLTFSIHTGCVVTPDMVLNFSVENEQLVEYIWKRSTTSWTRCEEWVRHDDGKEQLWLTFKDANCLVPDQPGQESYLLDEIINMTMLLVRKKLRNETGSAKREVLLSMLPTVIANLVDQYNDYGPSCILNSFFLTKAQQPVFNSLVRWIQNSLALARPIVDAPIELVRIVDAPVTIHVPFRMYIPVNCGTSQKADHWAVIEVQVTDLENNVVNAWPGYNGYNGYIGLLNQALLRAVGVIQEAIAKVWPNVQRSVSGEESASESETEPSPDNSWNVGDPLPRTYNGCKLIPNSTQFHEGSEFPRAEVAGAIRVEREPERPQPLLRHRALW